MKTDELGIRNRAVRGSSPLGGSLEGSDDPQLWVGWVSSGAFDHLYDPTNPVQRPGGTTSTSTRRAGFSSAGRVLDEPAGPAVARARANAPLGLLEARSTKRCLSSRPTHRPDGVRRD